MASNAMKIPPFKRSVYRNEKLAPTQKGPLQQKADWPRPLTRFGQGPESGPTVGPDSGLRPNSRDQTPLQLRTTKSHFDSNRGPLGFMDCSNIRNTDNGGKTCEYFARSSDSDSVARHQYTYFAVPNSEHNTEHHQHFRSSEIRSVLLRVPERKGVSKRFHSEYNQKEFQCTAWNMANNGNVSYRHQRAVGPATVLAIGKATPPTAYPQSEYPDFFFDVTNTSHKTELKAKFARICKSRWLYIFLLDRMSSSIVRTRLLEHFSTRTH